MRLNVKNASAAFASAGRAHGHAAGVAWCAEAIREQLPSWREALTRALANEPDAQRQAAESLLKPMWEALEQLANAFDVAAETKIREADDLAKVAGVLLRALERQEQTMVGRLRHAAQAALAAWRQNTRAL